MDADFVRRDAEQSQLVSPENGTWDTVFGGDVARHVQFGVFVPNGFSTDPTAFNFDIDKVTISTPEPGSAALVGPRIDRRRLCRAKSAEESPQLNNDGLTEDSSADAANGRVFRRFARRIRACGFAVPGDAAQLGHSGN